MPSRKCVILRHNLPKTGSEIITHIPLKNPKSQTNKKHPSNYIPTKHTKSSIKKTLKRENKPRKRHQRIFYKSPRC